MRATAPLRLIGEGHPVHMERDRLHFASQHCGYEDAIAQKFATLGGGYVPGHEVKVSAQGVRGLVHFALRVMIRVHDALIGTLSDSDSSSSRDKRTSGVVR